MARDSFSGTVVSMSELALGRDAMVQRGRRLEYFTVGWNCLEGIVAVLAGIFAGSISLVGYGVDSFIEVTSGAALLWRLSLDAEAQRRERLEKLTLRIVGICFLALAAYVGYEAISALVGKRAPERSLPGILLACASLVVMPLLSRAKRRVALHLKSAALHADAKQTEFCTYLSAILLGGLLLNAALNLWWADPVAALVMVPIIAKEGVDGLWGETCCDGK
jgi:divalent metal cation (Fe/Co/Zn/Cd) transporter